MTWFPTVLVLLHVQRKTSCETVSVSVIKVGTTVLKPDEISYELETVTGNVGLVSEASKSHVNEVTEKADADVSTFVINTVTDTADVSYIATKQACCVDQIGWQQCIQYTLTSCQGMFRSWASSRCQAYCGLCPPCPLDPCDDAVSDCQDFGDDVCSAPSSRVWAHRNCAKHCGFCTNYGYYNVLHSQPADTTTTDAGQQRFSSTTSTTPTSSSAQAPCVDVISQCDEYGTQSCVNYPQFMTVNCAKFCGFCSDTRPACQDQMSDCARYGKEACLAYEDFRHLHCPAYCNSCDVSTTQAVP